MLGGLAARRRVRRDRRALLILWTIAALKRATALHVWRVTDLSIGNIYVVLTRLEADGLVDSGWEVPEPHPDGTPRRRFYWVTELGYRRSDELLVRLRDGDAT